MLTSEVLRGREAPNLHYHGAFKELKQWEEYRYFSDVPILEDEEQNADYGPPYKYTVVCVRSGSKIIVLAEKKKVADYVIAEVLNRRIYPNVRKVGIRVESLIRSCQSNESQYLITALYGRYSGSDRKVNKVSLFGQDLTDSTIYKEHHHLFNFYTCGVARRLYQDLPRMNSFDSNEIMQVGNDGFLSIWVTTRERAREAISLINYIVRNRWVDAWVPDVEMKIDGDSKSA